MLLANFLVPFPGISMSNKTRHILKNVATQHLLFRDVPLKKANWDFTALYQPISSLPKERHSFGVPPVFMNMGEISYNNPSPDMILIFSFFYFILVSKPEKITSAGYIHITLHIPYSCNSTTFPWSRTTGFGLSPFYMFTGMLTRILKASKEKAKLSKGLFEEWYHIKCSLPAFVIDI